MTMYKVKREKGLFTKVSNGAFCGPGETRRCWVIFAFALCMCLPTATFTVVSILNLGNGQTGRLISSLGQPLRPSSKDSRSKNWNNILVKESSNYTSTLTSWLHLNASRNSPCHEVSTNKTKLEGLPNAMNGRILFETDRLHHLTLVTYDENGERRCAGGDYYEVDFHDRDNVHYRSRLPTMDFGNGSYGLELLVPSRFAGAFSLKIFLLYGNWHGLEMTWTSPWLRKVLVLTQELEMGEAHHEIQSADRKPLLKQCTQADFNRTTWQGRWTRSWYNRRCKAEKQTKRFRCLPKEHSRCEEPWCFGPLGRLESNGWHYSAHCSFKIFEREEAWKCLDGRWFMMWGDSNFQDTIRNLLLFILEWKLPSATNLADFQLSRTYEMAFTNSYGYDQLFRVSQLFNGAEKEFGDHKGLTTLKYKLHQDLLLAHFNGTKWPDTIIMNSGMHDAVAFPKIEFYAKDADFMIGFWMKIYKSLPADRRPQLIWRATIAPAGEGRGMPANPNKLEMFNQVMAEKLQAVHDQMPVKFVDAFDLTFPFHYDHNFSDGGHYGRAPGADVWPWYKKPHWYFVDVMLAHILLNALCPST